MTASAMPKPMGYPTWWYQYGICRLMYKWQLRRRGWRHKGGLWMHPVLFGADHWMSLDDTLIVQHRVRAQVQRILQASKLEPMLKLEQKKDDSSS